MKDRRDNHAALPLIEALLDGTIDDAGFMALESLLRDDAEARALYRSLASMHAALPSIVGGAPRVTIHLIDGTGESTLLEQPEMPREQFLSLLMQMEAQGEDLDPMVLAAERFPATKPTPLTKRDWVQAGRYVLSQVKHYRQQAIMGTAAAVMLLAAISLLVWSGSEQGGLPVASDELVGMENIQDIARVPLASVATLTAVRDARWDTPAGSLAPNTGDALHPGDRLTLTAGFAQVTTQRGAVLILEAPATVEFTHNSNALLLDSGKLVGICETDSAKGFLVRTPHFDVIDLGTRFGVTSDPKRSSTEVIEGAVEVVSLLTKDKSAAVQLTAGQAVAVDADAGHVEQADAKDTDYVYRWQWVSDAPELAGAVRYEPLIPNDLRTGAYERDDIMVFPERHGVSVEPGVRVNVVASGKHENEALQQTVELGSATVDSYLFHLDTPANVAPSQKIATIRFSRPIVGVVTSSDIMAQTHERFGMADVRYGSMPGEDSARFGGLDISANSPETVEISDDRMELRLNLSVSVGLDQFRVLVQSGNVN